MEFRHVAVRYRYLTARVRGTGRPVSAPAREGVPGSGRADVPLLAGMPDWRGGRHSGRVDIPERPAEAGRKERAGGWEADTVIGKGRSGAVVSLVDRASKHTCSRRAGRRASAAVSAAMLAMPGPSAVPVHTVTADSGKGFAGHAGVAEALGASFHFATPCHSWERGLNGHTNGLVRQYPPKGTDLRAVTDAEVRRVQDRTDARPRRVLGYRTPAEVPHQDRPP